ncbi:YhdP family protein [Spartinivicinus poritis]|uniref:YhdP family protein n=1 Tax=Spartinivicinus poritis TaxID=2994640 RepID=A0ABT5UCA3_9GAMM|nr:YhdP family protein [Spartinivicinus sp. A2-2]MDE1462734.1 YhdP family protein [Spartinivicinus sp. A2-2]
MKRFAKFFTRLIWSISIVGVVLLALYVSLGRMLLPLLADYRESLQQELSTTLNIPVTIATLAGTWSGFNPALDIKTVQIGETELQSLSANRVLAELDVFSTLIEQSPVFRYLQVEGLHLYLIEGQSGGWHLKGFNRTAGEADPKLILTSLLKQPHIQFTNTTIHFQDREGQVKTLEDTKLAFNQTSEGYRLDGYVRQAQGGEAKLIAEMQQVSPNSLGHLQLFIDASPNNWKPWVALITPDDIQLDNLHLGGKLWLNWQNKQLTVSGRLENIGLAIQYQDLPKQQLSKGYLQFNFNRQSNKNWQLALPSANFRLNGVAAPFHNAFISYQQGKWTVASEQINLNLLKESSLATKLLPEFPAQLVTELNPRGLIQQLVVDWSSAMSDFQLLGKLKQVAVAAKGFAPSASGVSGLLYTNAEQGWFDLDSQQGFSLGMVELFRKPWQYRQATAHLAWLKNAETFQLYTNQAQLKHRGAEYNAKLRLVFPLTEGPITMALQAGVKNADAGLAYQYIPAKHDVLPEELVKWLDEAIVAGKIEQGAFMYNGPVTATDVENDISFGLFFNVAEGTVQYDSQWPKADKLTGRVLVDNTQVDVNIASGVVHQADIQQLKLQVAEQSKDNFAVTVNSQLKVPGPAVNHLLTHSPIGDALGTRNKNTNKDKDKTKKADQSLQINGQFDSTLKLMIPIDKPEETEVVVTTQAKEGTINTADLGLVVEQINGQIAYHSKKGITGNDIQLTLFGHPARLNMSAKPVKRQLQQQFSLTGKADAPKVANWLQHQLELNNQLNQKQQQQFNKVAKGQFSYSAKATMPFDQPENFKLLVKSNLKGTAVNLPEPLHKSATEQQSVNVELNQFGKTNRWRVKLGSLLQSEWLVQQGQLVGADLFFGQGRQASKLKRQQLNVSGQLAGLDLAKWWPWVDMFTADTQRQQKHQPKWQLSVDQLKLNELYSPVGVLEDLVLSLNTYQQVWQAEVESDQLAGRAVIPFNSRQKPYEVALKRLHLPTLPKTAKNSKDQDPLAGFNPLTMPDMDIEVADLKIGNQVSGSFAAKLKNTPQTLKINNISAQINHLRVKGNINWHKQQTDFKGVVRAVDLADVLEAWGQSASITSKKAKFSIDVNWPGSPLNLSMAKLNGEIYSKIEHGRFLEAKGSANVLRVFGLLNFSSIARRIKLDFSDLLKSGVSFDKIKATTQFANGEMRFKEPVEIEGPSSNFALSGKANLVNDTLNMSLLVTLPVTNNLPFLAVLMGAPQVGGAIYLFDKLLGDKVEKFASARYTLTGSFSNPTIALDKFFTDKTKQQ